MAAAHKSDSYFQKINAACRKADMISSGFLESDNELLVLRRPPPLCNQAPLGCGGTGDSCCLYREDCTEDRSLLYYFLESKLHEILGLVTFFSF